MDKRRPKGGQNYGIFGFVFEKRCNTFVATVSRLDVKEGDITTS